MSLSFSDTTNKDGILQRIEMELGFPDGFITGDTTRLKQWTGSVNLGLDRVFHIIFEADGKWNFDDRNHTDYPIITTNLIDGQRDYSFTTDGSSNLILDVARVFVRNSTSAPYYEIYPVDVQSAPEAEITGFVDGQNREGSPYTYDKTATGIFLDPIPSANVTAGLKIYINREGSYFTTADTTKTPGFAGLYHEYLVLEPAYRYARVNGLKSHELLKRDLLELGEEIKKYYSRRAKDERHIITGKKINYI